MNLINLYVIHDTNAIRTKIDILFRLYTKIILVTISINVIIKINLVAFS